MNVDRCRLTLAQADLASSWTREALLTAHGNRSVRVGDTDEILKNDLDGERTLMLQKFITEVSGCLCWSVVVCAGG